MEAKEFFAPCLTFPVQQLQTKAGPKEIFSLGRPRLKKTNRQNPRRNKHLASAWPAAATLWKRIGIASALGETCSRCWFPPTGPRRGDNRRLPDSFPQERVKTTSVATRFGADLTSPGRRLMTNLPLSNRKSFSCPLSPTVIPRHPSFTEGCCLFHPLNSGLSSKFHPFPFFTPDFVSCVKRALIMFFRPYYENKMPERIRGVA